jgi:hypothetical protein
MQITSLEATIALTKKKEKTKKTTMNTHTLSCGSYKILITIGMLFLFEGAVDDHQ